jgi:hypothetical protein
MSINDLDERTHLGKDLIRGIFDGHGASETYLDRIGQAVGVGKGQIVAASTPSRLRSCVRRGA